MKYRTSKTIKLYYYSTFENNGPENYFWHHKESSKWHPSIFQCQKTKKKSYAFLVSQLTPFTILEGLSMLSYLILHNFHIPYFRKFNPHLNFTRTWILTRIFLHFVHYSIDKPRNKPASLEINPNLKLWKHF